MTVNDNCSARDHRLWSETSGLCLALTLFRILFPRTSTEVPDHTPDQRNFFHKRNLISLANSYQFLMLFNESCTYEIHDLPVSNTWMHLCSMWCVTLDLICFTCRESSHYLGGSWCNRPVSYILSNLKPCCRCGGAGIYAEAMEMNWRMRFVAREKITQVIQIHMYLGPFTKNMSTPGMRFIAASPDL